MFTYDGRNLKSITGWLNDSYFPGSGDDSQSVAGRISASTAYKYVAYLYRAISIRCTLVSTFPFSAYNLKTGEKIEDITKPTSPYYSIFSKAQKRWYMTEGSACLYGAGYWLIEANASGRNVTPRWITTGSIQPLTDVSRGLYAFRRNHKDIPLDQVVWFWEPNFDSETAPGVGCAQVALSAAGMLYALDSFATGFFNRGGVGVTIFEIPLGTPQAEKDKFQEWLNRRIAGIANAWRMIAVRGGVKPTTIGADIRNTSSAELTDSKRQDVAVATGIPVSVIDGKSSDDSNSRSEKAGMYTDFIIPRVEMLYETANEKFYHRFGIEIRPEPERLEVMQNIQLAQAQTVSELIPGQQIISLNEARDILGKEKSDNPDADKIGKVVTQTQPINVYHQNSTAQPVEESEADQTQVTKALTEWRKEARAKIKSGGVFVLPAAPNVIPDELVIKINAALGPCKTVAEVNAAFESVWPRRNVTTTKAQVYSETSVTEIAAELRAYRLAIEKATKVLENV